jgi:glycosyltransferase involved in cell wall biosynthesis
VIQVDESQRRPVPWPSVAVVVCTSTRKRAALLRACVDSVLAGERAPEKLYVVVDGDVALASDVAAVMPPEVCVLRSDQPGLSRARNVGLAAANSDLVAFVDDDARVDGGWLTALTEVFAGDAHVLGAGGPVTPIWGADRRWMPDELLWVVGCTYHGHRDDAGPIRNPIGCNMAFRRHALLSVGGFSTRFGKRGRSLQTCDETELGLRLEHVYGPGRIVYVPSARVEHFVPAERVSWRLVLRRSVSEGVAKGRLRRLYVHRSLGPERSYARLLVADALPRLFYAGLCSGDRQAVMGGIAVLASGATAGVAFLAGFAREGRARRPARDPLPPRGDGDALD